MLKRVLLVLFLSIFTNPGSADCWHKGRWYPDGARIGNYICLGNDDKPKLSTSVKNWLWLIFGSGLAVGAAVFLYRSARQPPKRRVFSLTLYGAATLLCIEVLVTFILFFARS